MNNLNSILIEGNLVRDPLLRHTPKGTAVCTMSLASNRYYKQETGFEKEVSFFNVESWSLLAESCYNKGKKGRGVRVVGRLKQDRWTGVNGKPQSRVTIVAEHVEFRPEFVKNKAEEAEREKEQAEIESSFDGECHDLDQEELPVEEMVDESTAEEVSEEEALKAQAVA
jgi:single-strand DNA-binding protein